MPATRRARTWWRRSSSTPLRRATRLLNPTALKRALDTGGTSLLKGVKNLVHDLRHNNGPAVVGRQVAVRDRPEPLPVAGQRGLPQRRAGADPVQAARSTGLPASAGDLPAAGQQVLRDGPLAREEPGQVRGRPGPADLRDELVQPDARSSATGTCRTYVAGAGRSGRRGAPDHRQPRREPVGRLLGRHDRWRPTWAGSPRTGQTARWPT